MLTRRTSVFLGALTVIGLLAAQPAYAQKTVSGAGIIFNVDNLSPNGIDVGKLGFWFANFDTPTAVSGEAVDSNDINQLPSWIIPVFDPTDPDYSFGDFVTSSSNPLWDIIRLPDGTTGTSGSLVDPETDNNSNNTVPRLALGPGTPESFIMRVVVDNTALQHDPANRIRGRAESADGVFDEDFRYNTSPADFNGTADLYSFQYDGWEEGDFIKIQLNSGVAGIDAGFAGLLFDVPEPSSLSLIWLGLVATTGAVGIRRHRNRAH